MKKSADSPFVTRCFPSASYCSGHTENITVVGCVYASGTYIPAMILFKDKRLYFRKDDAQGFNDYTSFRRICSPSCSK